MTGAFRAACVQLRSSDDVAENIRVTSELIREARAKGADFIALKIRSIAEDHAIPVIEDPPLARSLHASVDVDRPIPAEFYRAVAEIVHLIQQRKARLAQRRQ